MSHDFRSYIAMGGISAIGITALLLGVNGEVVGQVVTALAGLGGAAVVIRALRGQKVDE